MKIRQYVLGALALGGTVLPLAGAGTAAAACDAGQAVSAGAATVANEGASFVDAVNGADRPAGADGDETEFPALDYRYLEGPAGGLLNGPFN
jgi:hypothetical protein